MSLNPLLNVKRLKTAHPAGPADKSRTLKGERKRGGLIINPLPTPVKDVNHDTHILQPLPARDTPVIERNRAMRGDPVEGRRSSVGRRGKRASSSFENKGLIPQPHPTLDPSLFFKHIDLELPDAHRLHHLLVWCAARAVTTTNTNINGSSSASSSAPSSSSLPPLPAHGLSAHQYVLRQVQRLLLEKQIALNFGHDPNEASTSTDDLRPHERNIRNLQRERDYTEYNQRCTQESDTWSALVESYHTRQRSFSELLTQEETESHEWVPPDVSDPLYEREMQGAQLARKCKEGPSSEKSPISLRIAELENKIDRMHSALHIADQMANRNIRHLDKRFEAISGALAARSQAAPSSSSGESSSLRILSSKQPPHSASGPTEPPDTVMLLRALSRTDMENPNGMGDAARKAARDARQSVGTAERRLTAVTRPALATPRRPGTPRRKTPSNDNGGNG